MEITLVGIVCLLGCLLAVWKPDKLGVAVFGAFMPLQAAAAFNLWSVGGLSIVCVHVLAGALVLSVALRPRLARVFVKDALARPATLFLAAFVLYAVFAAMAMPHVFGGSVDVFSLERPAPGRFISLSALRPSTGNITQSLYLAIELALFAVLAFMVSRPRGIAAAFLLVNTATAVHLFFAVAGAFPGLFGGLLDAIRTANYSIAPHHVIGGFRRLIGSYTEPSAFGAMSAGLFAYNVVRFMQTRGLWFCIASAALLLCVAASMSTTAYVVLGLLMMLWCAHAAISLVRRGLSSEHVTALLACGAASGLVLALFFHEPTQILAGQVFEKLFRTKMESLSGVERAAWNMQSFRNLIDTNGLGVGLGSARASSLVAVLPGNVGAPGTLLYIGFLLTAFLKFHPRGLTVEEAAPSALLARRTFAAARAGALAMLFAHLISGTNVDGGVQFFAFAAIACGAYSTLPETRRARRGAFVWNAPPLKFEGKTFGQFDTGRPYWPRRAIADLSEPSARRVQATGGTGRT